MNFKPGIASTALATLGFAAILAAPATLAAEIGGPDNSLSVFGGGGYVYFHEAQPAGDRSVTPFRVTNPHGLSYEDYAAASSEDPAWQPAVVIDKAAPAADPWPAATTKAEKIARFRAQDAYLAAASTR